MVRYIEWLQAMNAHIHLCTKIHRWPPSHFVQYAHRMENRISIVPSAIKNKCLITRNTFRIELDVFRGDFWTFLGGILDFSRWDLDVIRGLLDEIRNYWTKLGNSWRSLGFFWTIFDSPQNHFLFLLRLLCDVILTECC